MSRDSQPSEVEIVCGEDKSSSSQNKHVHNPPDVPVVNSTALLASELRLSLLAPAPFAAQLQRICRLPSHFPFVLINKKIQLGNNKRKKTIGVLDRIHY